MNSIPILMLEQVPQIFVARLTLYIFKEVQLCGLCGNTSLLAPSLCPGQWELSTS